MGTILSSFVLTLLENLKMDNVTIVMNRRQFGYLVKRKGVWDWVLYESCPRTRSRQINIQHINRSNYEKASKKENHI